jgi:TonB family protein
VSHARAAIWNCLATLITVWACASYLASQNRLQFPASPSPGRAIQDAAQAAISDRHKNGAVDIISDTQGVDFGPYLNQAISTVRTNWYASIPSDAENKKGKLAIEFEISRDGTLANMRLIATSGNVSLDRAAWRGIKDSRPFPALPSAFTGPFLALRFRFYYNPDKGNLEDIKPVEDISPPDADPVAHAVVLKNFLENRIPDYPKDASLAKIDGIVRLEADVGADGKIKHLRVLEGNPLLANASLRAIEKWRFHPARRDGKPIEDQVRIKVEFRLDGEQVRARVVWPEALPSANPAP